jgi:DNA-binding GntR family transcriptional regulator
MMLEAYRDEIIPARPVQRELLGKQISDALRRDILLGVIKPGTRLSQQQLCERFGTSRMPVRDGLRVLAHEGLLITDSAQHTIVAPLSRADLLDAYWIEGTLAGMAATRASERAGAEDLDRLDESHHQMLEAAAAGGWERMARLNWSFHRSINRLSGSRKLINAIKSMSLDLPRDYLMAMPDWSAKSNEQHGQILEAMRARRHDKAGSLMTKHVVDSGRGLIAMLESRGLDLD